MTRKDEILKIRLILMKRRKSLRQALAGDWDLLKKNDKPTNGDMVDAALDSVQDSVSSQLVEVESRELERVEYALEKIGQGKFGLCEGCGAIIPMARLQALLYATNCIQCQRKSERQAINLVEEAKWNKVLDPLKDVDTLPDNL
jgi:DnaK suppressor protein